MFKRVIGERMPALRLRTSATRSVSPLMSFGLLISFTWIDQEFGKAGTHVQSTKHKQGASQDRQKKRVEYSRVPKRCLISSPTGVELLVPFAECLVALL